MMTLLAFLLTLGILIVVHEFGHFYAARRCGVKVLQFSVGFGRTLWHRKFGQDETEFTLAAFPLGGFVRMLDEREAPVAPHELERAFNRQPVWKRIVIVAAGPFANLLLAVLLYWMLFMAGQPGIQPLLGSPEPGSVAARAGFKSGERITQVDQVPVKAWQEVRWAVLQRMLDVSEVAMTTRDELDQPHVHMLDISGVKTDDARHDVMDQLGLRVFRPPIKPVVGELLAGEPAMQAGLATGDWIRAINGRAVTDWEEVVTIVRQNPARPLVFVVDRGQTQKTLTVTPKADSHAGTTVGRMGAGLQVIPGEFDRYSIEVREPPLQAMRHAMTKTWEMSAFSLRMLGRMVVGQASLKDVSGPVTIASLAGQTLHIGWKPFVDFLALVSLSLGVLNLLPVPVLDGGHLMYYMAEILRGKPLSEKTMEYGMRLGLVLIGMLMLLALYNDINRLTTG